MMAQHVPHQAKDKRRVKVYELRNNDWFDRGTGFCTAAFTPVCSLHTYQGHRRGRQKDAGRDASKRSMSPFLPAYRAFLAVSSCTPRTVLTMTSPKMASVATPA